MFLNVNFRELNSSYIMSYSRSPSSLLRYPAAQPCFAASYLKFTRLAGIAHYITTINTNHQSDSKNKIDFKLKDYKEII